MGRWGDGGRRGWGGFVLLLPGAERGGRRRGDLRSGKRWRAGESGGSGGKQWNEQLRDQ